MSFHLPNHFLNLPPSAHFHPQFCPVRASVGGGASKRKICEIKMSMGCLKCFQADNREHRTHPSTPPSHAS